MLKFVYDMAKNKKAIATSSWSSQKFSDRAWCLRFAELVWHNIYQPFARLFPALLVSGFIRGYVEHLRQIKYGVTFNTMPGCMKRLSLSLFVLWGAFIYAVLDCILDGVIPALVILSQVFFILITVTAFCQTLFNIFILNIAFSVPILIVIGTPVVMRLLWPRVSSKGVSWSWAWARSVVCMVVWVSLSFLLFFSIAE